jgi:hypothetical protein
VQAEVLQLKDNGVNYSDCEVETLKMLSFVMYKTLGFNLGTSQFKIQNIWARTRKSNEGTENSNVKTAKRANSKSARR